MDRKQIVDKVGEYVRIANTHYKTSYSPSEIGFFKSSTDAGEYVILTNSIKFNEEIAKANGKRFEETVAHEVAHMFVNKHYHKNAVIQQHGRQFKEVMKLFGFPNATRHHNLDVTKISTKKGAKKIYIVSCGCRQMLVTKVVADNPTMYRCDKCKKTLTYKGTINNK